ncbi:NAD-dependent protein deacetylase [Nocardioides mesophilus]|uniref:NAD-dependent protein deacetylase n=1 Tax=Nocardioides mesophilus TaxID=433659 RepID=UPI001FE6E3E7|nr:NAD-dependent protein deacetylase [Nocardioides mesophilus]
MSLAQRVPSYADAPAPPGAAPAVTPDRVHEVLADRPLVALTGAGLSTDSGIPDYRGPGAPTRAPMTYQEFVSGPEPQRRYWARSHVGWSRMGQAQPNAGHLALARLEARGRVRMTITQNVDGLHESAGSRQLCALHGRIAEVVCLGCREVTSRLRLAARMTELNPDWLARHGEAAARPDGDVDLDGTHDFVVPGCESCGGVLKPDVVFFGENVPKTRVQRCYDAVEEAAGLGGALLVLGSSLTVMSGLRFVRRAAKLAVPVVIVNRGGTRGDDLATAKLEAGTSEFLAALAGPGA